MRLEEFAYMLRSHDNGKAAGKKATSINASMTKKTTFSADTKSPTATKALLSPAETVINQNTAGASSVRSNTYERAAYIAPQVIQVGDRAYPFNPTTKFQSPYDVNFRGCLGCGELDHHNFRVCPKQNVPGQKDIFFANLHAHKPGIRIKYENKAKGLSNEHQGTMTNATQPVVAPTTGPVTYPQGWQAHRPQQTTMYFTQPSPGSTPPFQMHQQLPPPPSFTPQPPIAPNQQWPYYGNTPPNQTAFQYDGSNPQAQSVNNMLQPRELFPNHNAYPPPTYGNQQHSQQYMTQPAQMITSHQLKQEPNTGHYGPTADNSTKKAKYFVIRTNCRSQRPLNSTAAMMPQMPISIDNGFPNLTLDLGDTRDTVELMGLFDTCGSLNTGYLPFHVWIASQHPEIVEDLRFSDSDNPFDPIKLEGAVSDPSGCDTSQHGLLTAVIRYKTPYTTIDGSRVTISLALGNDVSTNTIFGLPTLESFGFSVNLSTMTADSSTVNESFTLKRSAGTLGTPPGIEFDLETSRRQFEAGQVNSPSPDDANDASTEESPFQSVDDHSQGYMRRSIIAHNTQK